MDIQITVNGKPYVMKQGSSLEEFFLKYCLDMRGVAVALNMQIVPNDKHAKTLLCEGDRLDIVRAVAGG